MQFLASGEFDVRKDYLIWPENLTCQKADVTDEIIWIGTNKKSPWRIGKCYETREVSTAIEH